MQPLPLAMILVAPVIPVQGKRSLSEAVPVYAAPDQNVRGVDM
jgi:hypothetical protein